MKRPLLLSQARMCCPHKDLAWVTTSCTDTVLQPNVVESFLETASLTLENLRYRLAASGKSRAEIWWWLVEIEAVEGKLIFLGLDARLVRLERGYGGPGDIRL